MSLKVHPDTASRIMNRIRLSMPERDYRQLTIAELLALYSERKLEHLLERVR